MNEYQDQDVWFELQEFAVSHGGWATVADADTREDIERIARSWDKVHPDARMRVKRVTGLG